MAHELTPRFMADPMGWHYDVIPPLLRALRPEVYVELGVREANLFNLVAQYAGTAIGVDIDPASGEAIEPAANVQFHLCSTDEYLEEIKAKGIFIDVLFIDADHSEGAAYADFCNYLPYVRPHGLILMHDAHPGDISLLSPSQCGGVCRAVERLGAENSEYEMVTIPFSPGLVICRKRSKQLSWEEPDTGVAPAQWRGAAPEFAAPVAAVVPVEPSADELRRERAVRRTNRVKATFRPIAATVLGEERLKRMLARARA